jgi:hypothetical protein
MKTILKIFLFCFLTLFTFSTYAQGSITLSNINTDNQTGWQVFKHLELADIYYKNTNCSLEGGLSFQYLLIKVVNQSPQAINVEWEYKFYYNDQEIIKSPDDMQVKLSIDANSFKEGVCNFDGNSSLKVLVSENDGSALITSIDLVNININQ